MVLLAITDGDDVYSQVGWIVTDGVVWCIIASSNVGRCVVVGRFFAGCDGPDVLPYPFPGVTSGGALLDINVNSRSGVVLNGV